MSYRGLTSYCVLNSNNARVKKHTLATDEASDGTRPPRNTTASDRLVLPAPARRLSLLGSLGWAGAAPKPHAGKRRGYNDRTSERSRNLLDARVVWEAKRDEKLGLRRP